MSDILTYDLIRYIIGLIYKDKNMNVIKKQKTIKNQLILDINKLFNTIHCDNSILLYKNNGKLIFRNLQPSKSIYLYHHGVLQDSNEIILTDQQYHEAPVRKKLYIMYI